MCSHYEAPTPARLKSAFGATVDEQYQGELWPLYMGPFVRLNPAEAQEDGAPEYDISVGQFGLLPGWAKDRKLGRSTYNCRSETAATKNSFRTAWKRAQHCIIPAAAIYEPDWRSGKAVSTRIERADGGLMAIAGLWEEWSDPDGKGRLSFTMLTVNADDHPFMRNYHRPEDEKRMLAILPNGSIKEWLQAPAEAASEFLRQYPSDRLRAA